MRGLEVSSDGDYGACGKVSNNDILVEHSVLGSVPVSSSLSTSPTVANGNILVNVGAPHALVVPPVGLGGAELRAELDGCPCNGLLQITVGLDEPSSGEEDSEGNKFVHSGFVESCKSH